MEHDWFKGKTIVRRVEKCPMCGEKALDVRELEYEAPYVGKIYVYSMKCYNCGYVFKRAYSLEDKKPCRIKYSVEDEEDLKALVIRSESARVDVPELDASIDPGPAAETVIMSLEGLLDRIREALVVMIRWAETPEQVKRGEEILKVLDEVLKGRRKVTLIIEDPRGLSAIIPPEGRKSKLKIEEMK